METEAAQQPGAEDAGRIAGLDGVRGVAIALVMVFHFMLIAAPPPRSAFDRVVAEISGVGWVGVDLFFVLSGFLITGILYDAKASRRHYFRNFYARRVLRIFPLYYLFLAIVLIALPLLMPLHSSDYHVLHTNQIWLWPYLTNIWIALRDGWNIDLYGTGHLWSLAVEEQFYLVWPFVVLAFGRRSLMRICAACVVGALALRVTMNATGTDPFVAYTFTPARVDALAIGALLALAMRHPADRARVIRYAPVVATACIVPIAGVIALRHGFSGFDPWVEGFGLTPLALLFAALIAMTLAAPATSLLHRWPEGKLLRALGRYSYGLYVLHWPIATWLAWQTSIGSYVPDIAGSQLADRLAFTLVASVLTTSAAVISWHLYERQFLKLKSRFPYRTSVAAARDALPRDDVSRLAPGGTLPLAS